MIFENDAFGDGPGRDFYEVQALRYVCKGVDVQTAEHACMGLLAETGEIAALYQKRGVGVPFAKADAISEAGDVLWMLTELCSTLEVKLYRVINESSLDRFQYEFSEDEETPEEAALHLCEAAAKVVGDVLPSISRGTIPAPGFDTLHDLKMVAVRLARYGEAEGISMEKMAAENIRKMKRRFPKGKFDLEDYKTRERVDMKEVARRAVEEVLGRHKGCRITSQNTIPGASEDKVRFYFGTWLGDIAYAVTPCTMSFPELVELRHEVQKEYTDALKRKGAADEVEEIHMDLNGGEIKR